MPPRIASLLPSATEALFAMGLGDQVVAVSHACTVPEGAQARPAAVRTRVTETSDQAAIDAQVHELVEAGEPLYVVDEGVLHHVQPDLVVAQGTCQVCGAGPADVQAALMRIEPVDRPEVVSLHAHTLDEVIDGIRGLARRAGAPEAGERLARQLRARLDRVAPRRGHRGVVAFLEALKVALAMEISLSDRHVRQLNRRDVDGQG
jgi:iron complex transport system substrate-binding protein